MQNLQVLIQKRIF